MNAGDLVHGFTTRLDGDMRAISFREKLLSSLGFTNDDVILCEQTHGNAVAVVDQSHRGTRILRVDGLVYKDESDSGRVMLAVRVADCVPLLFVDRHTHIIGVAHAGWRGTVTNTARATIRAMHVVGARISDIEVIIGPHIGACCYTVDDHRVRQFEAAFPAALIVNRKGNDYTIDIGNANRLQLMAAGIKEAHVKDVDICTSCHVDTYFSYRKDTKESFGEILGFIGWNSI